MTFKFDLTEQEANIIMGALTKQPFESVADVIFKLRTQANEQIPKEEPKKD
jgi:hypothetical protein